MRAAGFASSGIASVAAERSWARGICPSVARPLETGDGFLARLPPRLEPLPPAAFSALLAAAGEFGNGIIEVTRRGTIQVRGLRPASVAGFGAALTAAGIDVGEGVPVFASPLAGLDPEERADVRPLAAALCAGLAAEPDLARRLAPKVSVLIDGGGRLHLDALAADLRVVAEPDWFRIALGGNAGEAVTVASVGEPSIVGTVLALLRMIADLGPTARGRDLMSQTEERMRGEAPARAPAEPIGVRRLRDGSVAVGVGLPFGHAKAAALAALVDVAVARGATGFAPAPGRALLAIGLAPDQAAAFASAAERLGFVARPDDPRRFVSACAGAPDCASGKMPARAVAPQLARVLAPILDGSLDVHVSGCGKGCAHPAAAALTLVGGDGGCGIVFSGRAGDAGAASLPARDLEPALTRLAAGVERARRQEERAVDVLARLGEQRIAVLAAGETVDG